MQRPAIRIAAVGDLQLGDSPICVGFGFRSRVGPAGLVAALAGVQPMLASADIVFGNLEGSLSDRGLRTDSWSSFQLRGRPEYVSSLHATGFTVLNLANNHAVQHGFDAFHETHGLLKDAGIATCGVRGSGSWSSEPVVLQIAAGPAVGVLGYCLRPRQYGSDEPPYAEGEPESMREDIRRLRACVDAVVVSLHWGEEFVDTPSAREVALGRSLIEAGACLLIGHHPHVVRPMERYHEGLIVYSLGNLIGDMVWHRPFRRGALLRCVLSEDSVVDAELIGTRLHEDFRVTMDGSCSGPTDHLRGLEDAAYTAAIRQTQRQHRLAAYSFALRRLDRYPRGMLAQLAGRTLRNKVSWLLGGGD